MAEERDDATAESETDGGTLAGSAKSERAPGRRRRRARTPAPPGSDPHPAAEPERHDTTENDARLRADKPPHY